MAASRHPTAHDGSTGRPCRGRLRPRRLRPITSRPGHRRRAGRHEPAPASNVGIRWPVTRSGGHTTAYRSATIFGMANTTETYRRDTADGAEIVTIMAYLGADSGDSDEIRRVVERDGTVVEDG